MKDIKDYLQKKGQCKDKSISQKILIFACETSYIDIYVDLLLHGVVFPSGCKFYTASHFQQTC